jgi:hypothetical protein
LAAAAGAAVAAGAAGFAASAGLEAAAGADVAAACTLVDLLSVSPLDDGELPPAPQALTIRMVSKATDIKTRIDSLLGEWRSHRPRAGRQAD